ncbi:MAG: carbohydrate kinase family protein [Candidatus Uhrbacteria bacterium]
MLDIITIGDTKLDTFVLLNSASVQCSLKMPECLLCMDYGAKIAVEVVHSQIAGTAPNVATGLARMGRKTSVLTNMGKDATLAQAIETFKIEGVSSKLIHTVPKEASAYSVVLNYHGDRTLLTSHINRAYHFPKPMPKTKWMYVSEMGHGYETLYRSVTAYAKAGHAKIVLNPGSIQISEKKKPLFDLIKYTDILFANLEEAQSIAGDATTEVHKLAVDLWKLGAKHVVITDGKNGAYNFDGAQMSHMPVFPAHVVETTGAGDAFSTGYLGAIMGGESFDAALRWGSANSASVVQHVGPTKGLLTIAQIRSHLKKHPGVKPEKI